MKEDMKELYGYYYGYEFIKIGDGVFERRLFKKDIDYRNKTIIDIGSNLDSASFFYKQGAKPIICVDENDERLEEIRNYPSSQFQHDIFTKHKRIETCNDFYYLINDWSPDIVKIDIEGTEILLTANEQPEYIQGLKKPSFYIIELHPSFNLPMTTILGIWGSWCEKTGFNIVGRREIIHNTVKDFDKNKLVLIYLEPVV